MKETPVRTVTICAWPEDTPIAVLRAASGPTAVDPQLGGLIAGSGNAAVAVFWIEPEHLDTPRVIQNASHEPVWSRDSDPFGSR